MSEPQKDYVPATLDGLHQWLKHEYEHLGWNTLMSLEKGNPAKGLAYLQSLEKLGKAIEERKALNSSNPNVLRDLEVLEWKLGKLVKMTQTLGLEKEKLKTIVCAPITETREGATSPAIEPTASQVGGKKSRKSSKKASKKPSKKPSKKSQKGGAKKRGSKKTSKKSSKKTSKKTSKKPPERLQ